MFKLRAAFIAVLCTLTAFQLCQTTRVKRYLAFPKGASFIASVAITTFLPKDTIPLATSTGFGHIIEYDFGYSFPDKITIKPEPAKKKKKVPPVFYNGPPEYYWKIADKRKWNNRRKGRILEQLRSIIDRHGFNGESCVMRLACEIEGSLHWGRSLWEDLMLAIMPKPPSEELCISANSLCPFSMLHALMHSTHEEN